nr:immunoglobulin light chain junction region [Macaca mulatta]MOW55687.1 immunoglobulin light chain junction region [Macaca mulatta]MOX99847.1 immunoglobulin light chain junction region [Macaca mulatta]
CIQALDFPWTF